MGVVISLDLPSRLDTGARSERRARVGSTHKSRISASVYVRAYALSSRSHKLYWNGEQCGYWQLPIRRPYADNPFLLVHRTEKEYKESWWCATGHDQSCCYPTPLLICQSGTWSSNGKARWMSPSILRRFNDTPIMGQYSISAPHWRTRVTAVEEKRFRVVKHPP